MPMPNDYEMGYRYPPDEALRRGLCSKCRYSLICLVWAAAKERSIVNDMWLTWGDRRPVNSEMRCKRRLKGDK